MEALRLQMKLPPSLRNDFWGEMIDAIDVEFQLMRTEVFLKKTMYDLDNMTDDQLMEINNLLGVIFDATVNSTTEFIKREVEAIPFKIKYKATAKLYTSFPKSLGRVGQMFIYFYKNSSNAIIRNSKDLLESIDTHDPTLPFTHFSAENFTGYLENALKLDTGLLLDIENEGEIWKLDTVDSTISTNHVGIEFCIDQLITKQVRNNQDALVDKEFLMTREYLDFVTSNMEFARKAKEVPHIGSQLLLIGDSSNVFDSLSPTYTMPDLKAKVLTLPPFGYLNSVYEISYMEFGIGSHDVKSKTGSGILPTALDERVARTYILFDEKYSSDSYYGVVGEYLGQQINRFLLHNSEGYQLDDAYGAGKVDGINNNFKGTLLFAPVKKGNVKFVFYHEDNKMEIVDDGTGNLVGSGAYGTIDYENGKYSFSTDIDFRAETTIAEGDGSTTEFSYDFELGTPILSSASDPRVWVQFVINGRRYLVQDDGMGHFVHSKISSGTIDYTANTIHLIFTDPLTLDSELIVKYQYNKISTPDANSEIIVDYYFTVQSIEITEAGVFNENDELIAYATFPPLEFASIRNHVNIEFILKKTPFA